MEKVFKINSLDNVYIVGVPLLKGEHISIEGQLVEIERDLDRGHKLAAVCIRKGEKVVKFGLPIGSAYEDIQIGEHVHIHNLKSDYLPTFTVTERFKE